MLMRMLLHLRTAYHLGVVAVRAITNAFNCGEDLSSSLVAKEICAVVGTDSPGNLTSVLVSEGG
jgi:hypothetical protein